MSMSKLHSESSPSSNCNHNAEKESINKDNSLHNSTVIDELDKMNIDFQDNRYDRSQDKVHSFIEQYKKGQFDLHKSIESNNEKSKEKRDNNLKSNLNKSIDSLNDRTEFDTYYLNDDFKTI